MEDVINLVDELRDQLSYIVPTRDEKIPKKEDISKSDIDKHFDIDIFFSRKPGMRRSIQLITSDADNKDDVKLSCMVALCSLCDTMIDNKELNMTEEDILHAFLGWLEMHNIKDIQIMGS